MATLTTPFQSARAKEPKIINNKNIYFGITTGFNKAFIIDNDTKDALVYEDSKSVDLLRPLLRGRDIGRYQSNWKNQWIISTFPSSNVKIDDYPSIKRWLELFQPKLNQSGAILTETQISELKRKLDSRNIAYNNSKLNRSRKKTIHEWFELQDTCAYHAQFDKEKIIYPIITKNFTFAFDVDGMLTNDKCFIITGQNLKFLLAWFNSRMFRALFRDNFPNLGNGRELRKVFFRDIRVPEVAEIDTYIFESIEQLADSAIKFKQQTSPVEYSCAVQKIDKLIFEICHLTDKEIKVLDRLSQN